MGASWRATHWPSGASITNVMNYHTVTEITEQATVGNGQTPTGAYGMPAALQAPRSVRLSMSFDY